MCEDIKAYQYQSAQRFIIGYTYVKHIPDFDSIQLTKNSVSKYINLPKNIFRLNIFAKYFLLKLIVFAVHTFSI